MRRNLLLPLLLCACPKGPPPPQRPSEAETLSAQVRQIAAEAQAALEAQEEAVWKHWVEGSPLVLARPDAGFGPPSAERIAAIDRLRGLTEDPTEIRALTHLKTYLVGEHLAHAIAEQSEAVANLEASVTFTADGQEHAWRDLHRLLANERSAAKRQALYVGATSAVERLTLSLRRRDERIIEVLASLGYPSYEAYGAELRQVDLDQLASLADQVLRATQAAHEKLVGELARQELGLNLTSLRHADLPRLFRPSAIDERFPKEKLLQRAEETLRGMGLSWASIPGLLLETSESPRKNRRPLTVAVRVPGDVRLSWRPSGGTASQRELLHELGHALHYALTRPSRFELAKLGNGTVGEAYAQLFEGLVENPLWLEEHASLVGEQRAAYLRAAGIRELYRLRHEAGSFLYQHALRRQTEADGQALYAEMVHRIHGIRTNADEAARWLVEAEDFYRSADDFRARLLAAQLRAQLEKRFGPAFWRSAQAGAFLRGLFAHGNSRSAEEIAALAGERTLSPDALLASLSARLQVPMAAEAATPDLGSPSKASDGGR